MACLDACAGDPVLRIAALLHDVGKPRSRAFSDKTQDYTFYEHERIGAEMAEPICSRLRFSNEERARIVALVRHHLFHYDESGPTRRCGAGSGASARSSRRTSTRSAAPTCSQRATIRRTISRASWRSKVTRHGLVAGVRRSAKGPRAFDGGDLMNELSLPPGRQHPRPLARAAREGRLRSKLAL